MFSRFNFYYFSFGLDLLFKLYFLGMSEIFVKYSSFIAGYFYIDFSYLTKGLSTCWTGVFYFLPLNNAHRTKWMSAFNDSLFIIDFIKADLANDCLFLLFVFFFFFFLNGWIRNIQELFFFNFIATSKPFS